MGAALAAVFVLFAALTAVPAQESGKRLFPAEQGGKYGYIDSTGIPSIPFKFEYAWDFHDGLAKVEIDGQCGYIADSGEFVVQPLYICLYSEDFSGGLAQVSTQARTAGFIDSTGRMVIAEKSFMTGKFSEGLAKVWPASDPSEYGFIDKAGTTVIPAVYQYYACDFHEGLACVQRNGKSGFVSEAGNVVIPFQFEQAFDFSDGLAPAEIDRKWGFIGRSGTFVIPPSFDLAWSFEEGLAPARVGTQWGFVTKAGGWAIAPQFDEVNGFGEGVASVRVGTPWGVVRHDGTFAIAPQFEDAWYFDGGLAQVRIGPRWALINDKGDLVWKWDEDDDLYTTEQN